MNKFTKSLIATGLSVATVLPNTSMVSSAWAPTHIKAKCMGLSDLNEKGHISLPEKEGQEVCGCKTCTVDAVTYNKIGDYISILENEFDVQSKEADSLENRVKIDNIELILSSISSQIEDRVFANRNFLLVSTNYKPNEQDAIARFAYKDGITSNYDTDYFENINNEKIQPLLKKVSDYTSFMRGKEVPHIHNWGQDFKELGLALVIGIATALSIPKLHEGYQKMSEFFKNKDIKKLVGKFNGLSENLKNSAKKN